MRQLARLHHTVPRFYLDGFALQGQIGTVELPGDRRFTQSVKKASAINDFYTLPTADPQDADLFERSLGELETEAARVFKLIAAGTWPLTADDRDVLATFAAVQYVRGPNLRRQMEQSAALMTRLEVAVTGRDAFPALAKKRLGRDVSEEEAQRLWDQAVAPGGPPIRFSARQHIDQIMKTVPEIHPYFAGRPWTLLRFQRKRLVVCDTPVALIPSPDAEPHEGSGLLNAWGISVPVTRSIGLLMTDPRQLIENKVPVERVHLAQFDAEMAPTAAHAKLMNDATVRNARRWIFHHPNDRELVGDDLPDPLEAEFETSGGDFVEMGKRMRAHQAKTPTRSTPSRESD